MVESTLSYLLTGSFEILPSSYSKLRSYLNIHSANVAERNHLKIFKKNSQCPYCYTSWTYDSSSFKLLPTKKLKTRVRKYRQYEKLQECRNTMVLKCKVCAQKSLFSLVKKNNVKEKIQENEIFREQVLSKKKKKKRKDRLSGLLVDLKNKNKNTNTNKPSSALLTLKKEKGFAPVEENEEGYSVRIKQENPQKLQMKTQLNLPAKNKLNPEENVKRKLVINPFASLAQNKLSKIKNKKLEQLKKNLKGVGNNVAKKTLQDFLTLI